ncbi:MAG: ArgE/DapE family deacylase [Firmicutes bacterium]|nr:ArgE/DapE family deacylase [Bacillota bacterium]
MTGVPPIDRDKVRAWLRDMISIDSVNPTLVSGGAGEGAMARYLAGVCRDIGLEATVEGPSPDRPNIVATLRGSRPSRRQNLLLNGHLDTVGVGGMRDPLVAMERNGRVYGRGALDMKGGLAAILGAMEALSRSGLNLEGDVIFGGTSDEEHSSVGAQYLAPRVEAGAAVITEATGMRICVAHKGFAWVRVETRGRAAHGSRPSDGVDAIAHMGRFLTRLEGLAAREFPRRGHPLLGPPSLHASTVSGGAELSTYPDRCVLMYEMRTVPGETAETVLTECGGIIDSLSREDPSFKADFQVTVFRPPYEVNPGSRLVRLLGESFTRATGRPPATTGMACWLDSAIFGGAGIPSVIFGPGGEGAHADEEYVNVEDVLTVAGTLADLAVLFCGGADGDV